MNYSEASIIAISIPYFMVAAIIGIFYLRYLLKFLSKFGSIFIVAMWIGLGYLLYLIFFAGWRISYGIWFFIPIFFSLFLTFGVTHSIVYLDVIEEKKLPCPQFPFNLMLLLSLFFLGGLFFFPLLGYLTCFVAVFIFIISILGLGYMLYQWKVWKCSARKYPKIPIVFVVVFIVFNSILFLFVFTRPVEICGTRPCPSEVCIYYDGSPIDIRNIAISHAAVSNITNHTFKFLVSVLNLNLSVTYNYTFSNNQLYLSVSERNKQLWIYSPKINHTYVLRFKLEINSTDEELCSLKLFGENNSVTGNLTITRSFKLLYQPIGNHTNVTYESEREGYDRVSICFLGTQRFVIQTKIVVP